MNSVYKNYLKNTIILFAVVVLFSVFFIYIHNRDFYEYINEFIILDYVAVYILMFFLYRDRNKKTGIFIRFLPLKTTNAYMFKTILSVLFVAAVIIFQLIISYFYEYRGLLNNIFNPNSIDIFEQMHIYFIVFICMAAALTLSVNLIGVVGLALIFPIGALLCAVFAVEGIAEFLEILLVDKINFIVFIDDILEFVLFGYNVNSLLFYSIVIFIISGVINKYIDYSNIGRMFYFKRLYIPFSILVSFIGGFSLFYVITVFYDLYISQTSAVILVLVCIAISNKLFRSLYNYYK